MLLLAGTIPNKEQPLIHGRARIDKGRFFIDDKCFPVYRGTSSMIGAAITICRHQGVDEPYCVVAGDIGRGQGSRLIYKFLAENMKALNPSVCCFHYIMPDLVLHRELYDVLKNIQRRPFLIADAGYMYIAKMSGLADFYDLFTPDVGELAFLADKRSPHPFYTRGFIFYRPEDIEDFIFKAYTGKNAPRFLLVKGAVDFICEDGKIVDRIDKPDVEALECIGGTGDTITGMVAALIFSGCKPKEASYIAAVANRIAGSLANPTPATQVLEIICCIPEALKRILKEDFKGNRKPAILYEGEEQGLSCKLKT